jgi:hypothetical protein
MKPSRFSGSARRVRTTARARPQPRAASAPLWRASASLRPRSGRRAGSRRRARALRGRRLAPDRTGQPLAGVEPLLLLGEGAVLYAFIRLNHTIVATMTNCHTATMGPIISQLMPAGLQGECIAEDGFGSSSGASSIRGLSLGSGMQPAGSASTDQTTSRLLGGAAPPFRNRRQPPGRRCPIGYSRPCGTHRGRRRS